MEQRAGWPCSDKVEGTAHYRGDEQKIGSIERVMIDQMSSKVAYA